MSELMKGLRSFGNLLAENSPTILTSLSVVGLISTAIECIRATPKALMLIDDEVFSRYKDEIVYNDECERKISFEQWLGVEGGYSWSDRVGMLTKTEIIKLVWKTYLPAITMGAVTISCIIGSNRISLRRSAALASLYGITESAFKEYKSKVVETIGSTKEQKIRDDIAADRMKANPPSTSTVLVTGKGDVLCYDTLSGRYFRSDIDKIQRIVNSLNYELRSCMFLSLNELYYKLGLPNISLGENMGWDIDKGEIELKFSAQLSEDGEPCLVLEYTVFPKYKQKGLILC